MDLYGAEHKEYFLMCSGFRVSEEQTENFLK